VGKHRRPESTKRISRREELLVLFVSLATAVVIVCAVVLTQWDSPVEIPLKPTTPNPTVIVDGATAGAHIGTAHRKSTPPSTSTKKKRK
jgi:hypothetical protein